MSDGLSHASLDDLIRTFATLVASIPDSILTVDRELRVTSLNAAAERLYGAAASEVVGGPASDLVTDPRSQEAFLDRVFAGEAIPASPSVRPLRDGRSIHVIRSASPLYAPDGTIVGACVISRDITQEVQEREAREHAERRLRRAFDEALIAMALVDLDGRHTQVNDAACRLLGRPREELLGNDWTEFTHPEHRGDNALARARAMATGNWDRHVRQKRYLLPDGRVIWAELSGALVRDHDGTPSHFVLQIQDITHRRSEEARLRQMAEHDELTGLLNRHGFKTVLDAHLADVGRYRPSGAVFVIDLDNFKQHNDTLGHQAGDAVLESVGHCLSDGLRGSDIAGRMGGDEFVALLPHADRVAAEQVAKKLLDQISAAAERMTGAIDHPITASIGVACFDDTGRVSGEHILDLADRAMYRAKGSGKNQFAIHTPEAAAR